MNLKKLFSWIFPASPSVDEVASSQSPGIPDNVVTLNPAAVRPSVGLARDGMAQKIRVSGLMDAEEIVNFFADSYFSWGQHNGQNGGTGATLSHGRTSIITRFQNAMSVLIERKIASLHKIESQMLEIDGVSPVITGRLKLACDQIKRDMAVLEGQSVLAADGKGWVLEALNQYHSGFVRGLSASCDIQSLGG